MACHRIIGILTWGCNVYGESDVLHKTHFTGSISPEEDKMTPLVPRKALASLTWEDGDVAG